MLFLIVCGWLLEAAPVAQPHREVTTLQQWALAVQRHEPGAADLDAAAVAAWPRADLQAVLAALQDRGALVEFQKMLGLTDDEARRRDVNRLVKRGAMLHSDIAMLAQDGVLVATEPASAAPPVGARSIRVEDGRRRGPDDAERHWAMARSLLDSVTPDPGRDEWVHQWYRAAAARMRRDSLLGPAEFLLDRARQLFPKEPEFFFYGGCLHEALASPPIQSVLASATLPPGARVAPLLSGPQRDQAAVLFAGALALRPAWPEARLRLGRGLGLLGRHKEAAVELRRALDETSDLTLVYWASLFLGVEEQALGRDADARSCYQRALTCRPSAQAPHLALSQLARREGDRAQAAAEVRAVMELPADEASRYDPLWDYYRSFSSEADLGFATLRRQLGTRGAPGEGPAK